jgi:hypothetical protein
MEYLIIFGIAFMMTLPLIIIYSKQTNNVQADIAQIQVYKVATKISDYAEQVYYMGEPSQRTLYVTFPECVDSITVQGNLLTFNVTAAGLSYQVVKETTANMTGSIRKFSGEHILTFTAGPSVVTITDR